ncbi:MAG: FtsX-like permease family protein, partial [Pseudomonadota bacterium]
MTFSISMLGDRIERLLNLQAKEVLAADLVLESSSQLTDDQEAIIDSFQLDKANILTFQSMANTVDAESFLLSSVKAVSDAYPLLGELQITDNLYGQAYPVDGIPTVGEAWVEDRVLHDLDINIGDYINVGETAFKVTQIILYEPDRGNSFYSFTPRILINWDDIEATQVIKPGSRVKYRYLFAGEINQLDSLQQSLSETLQLNQQFVSLESGGRTLSKTFDRAYSFLNIIALVAVLLGAVAAALVSFHYANEMTHQYAIFRCLGMKSKQIIGAIVIPIVVYTLLAITLGFVIGSVSQSIIINTLGELVPENLPRAGIKPYLISSTAVLIIVVSFVWPFIMTLIKTSPKILLTNNISAKRTITSTAAFMLIGVSLLIYLATSDVLISVYIILALSIFIVFSLILINYLILLLQRLTQTKNTSTRLAIRNIKANHMMVSLQVIAVALTFFSLALVGTIRDDLIISWQSKVPENAPNVFVINLTESDSQRFVSYLNENDIIHNPMYPIVRGRLSEVNGINIDDYANKDTGRYDNSLQRDLALTWNDDLPKDNKIIQGEWGQILDTNNTVSVEQDLADNLDIKVGDMLSFMIETRKVSAQVNSIRSVEWESFAPNFYMIFSPSTLDEFPSTYITSLYLTEQQRPLISSFVKNYPSATFFDLDFVLERA